MGEAGTASSVVSEAPRQAELYTYPTHQASSIVSVYSTLSRVTSTADIALATKKDRVDQGLGFVEVVDQEDSGSNETEKNSEVVGNQIVCNAESHRGRRRRRPSNGYEENELDDE